MRGNPFSNRGTQKGQLTNFCAPGSRATEPYLSHFKCLAKAPHLLGNQAETFVKGKQQNFVELEHQASILLKLDGLRVFWKPQEECPRTFLYYKNGWHVSRSLGFEGGALKNPGEGEIPPTQGWLYDRRSCPLSNCQHFNDDPSLGLSWLKQIDPVCRLVNFGEEGAPFWRRLELQLPFKWSEGRLVYKNPKDPTEYLKVAEGESTWDLFKTDAGGNPSSPEVSSGRATLSPVDKEAGPSGRFGVSNWRWVGANSHFFLCFIKVSQ